MRDLKEIKRVNRNTAPAGIDYNVYDAARREARVDRIVFGIGPLDHPLHLQGDDTDEPYMPQMVRAMTAWYGPAR